MEMVAPGPNTETITSPVLPNLTPEAGLPSSTPELPVVEALPTQEEQAKRFSGDAGFISISGIKRAWTSRRLDRAVETQQTPLRRDEVSRATHEDNFPDPRFSPKTKSEQRHWRRQSRHRTKIMNANVEAIRLQSIHGSIDENGKTIKPRADISRTAYHTPEARAARALDRDNRQSPFDTGDFTVKVEAPNDLGTEQQKQRLRRGSYTRGRIKSELKAARQLHSAQGRANRHGERLTAYTGRRSIEQRVQERRASSAAEKRIPKLVDKLSSMPSQAPQTANTVSNPGRLRPVAKRAASAIGNGASAVGRGGIKTLRGVEKGAVFAVNSGSAYHERNKPRAMAELERNRQNREVIARGIHNKAYALSQRRELKSLGDRSDSELLHSMDTGVSSLEDALSRDDPFAKKLARRRVEAYRAEIRRRGIAVSAKTAARLARLYKQTR